MECLGPVSLLSGAYKTGSLRAETDFWCHKSRKSTSISTLNNWRKYKLTICAKYLRHAGYVDSRVSVIMGKQSCALKMSEKLASLSSPVSTELNDRKLSRKRFFEEESLLSFETILTNRHPRHPAFVFFHYPLGAVL